MIRRMETAARGAAGVAKALDRSPSAVDPDIHRRVEEIVDAVRDKGDAALLELTERFDRVRMTAGEGGASKPYCRCQSSPRCRTMSSLNR